MTDGLRKESMPVGDAGSPRQSCFSCLSWGLSKPHPGRPRALAVHPCSERRFAFFTKYPAFGEQAQRGRFLPKG